MARHAAGPPATPESDPRPTLPAHEAPLPEPLAVQVERRTGLDNLHHALVEAPHHYPTQAEERQRAQQLLDRLAEIKERVAHRLPEHQVPEIMALAEAFWLRTQGLIGIKNQYHLGHGRSEDASRLADREENAHAADELFADIRSLVYGEVAPSGTAIDFQMTRHPDEVHHDSFSAGPDQLVVIDMGLAHSPTTITAWRNEQGIWSVHTPAGQKSVSPYDTVIGRDQPESPWHTGITENNVATNQITMNTVDDGGVNVYLTGPSGRRFPVYARVIGPYPTPRQFHEGQAAQRQAQQLDQARRQLRDVDAAA